MKRLSFSQILFGSVLIVILMSACGKSARIEGRFFRSDSGQPITNARVLLHDLELFQNRSLTDYKPVAETTTDQNGNYVFENVKAGTYFLAVNALFPYLDFPCGMNYGPTNDNWSVLETKDSGVFLASGNHGDIFRVQDGEGLSKNVDLYCKRRTDSLIDQIITTCAPGGPLVVNVLGGSESIDRKVGILDVFARVRNRGTKPASLFATVQLRDQLGRLFPMVPESEAPGYDEMLRLFVQGAEKYGNAVIVAQSEIIQPNSTVTEILVFRVPPDAESFQIIPVDETCK